MGILSLVKTITPLIFYSLGLVMAFMALLGKGQWALMLLTFLVPLRNVVDKLHRFPMGDQFLDILIAGLLGGWVLSTLSGKNNVVKSSSISIVSFFLLFYVILSIFIGNVYINNNGVFLFDSSRIADAKNFCLLPVIYLLTLNTLQDKTWAWRLFWVMCAAMLLSGYYTANQVSEHSSLASRTKLSGTFQFLGPNEVAAFFNQYTIVILSVAFFIKDKKLKLGLILLSIFNIYCMVFLYSRAAYLGLAVGLFLLFAFKKKVLLVPFLIILSLWQVVLPQNAVERFQNTKNEYGKLEESAERRVVIWKQSTELFLANPVFGIGYGVFRYLGFDLGDTHNIYLKILVEQGLVGFLLFMIVILCFFREGFVLYQKGEDEQSKGLGLGLCICIIVLLTNNMFGDRWSYLELSGYLWIYAGLVSFFNSLSGKGLSSPAVAIEVSKNVPSAIPRKPKRKSYYK